MVDIDTLDSHAAFIEYGITGSKTTLKYIFVTESDDYLIEFSNTLLKLRAIKVIGIKQTKEHGSGTRFEITYIKK